MCYDETPSLRSFSLHIEAAGFAPPDAFGRFRVLHQIGAGTLGPVFRAYEPDRERLVAIKLFRRDLPPDRVHRLVDEFERLVASGLTHSGVAAPLATGIQDGSVYLVLEFVSAESLDVVVRDFGPALPVDTVGLGLQLAEALDFAAGLNINAGALHPRDVLVSSDEARLTGLGVVGALEQVGINAPVRPPYTAPERIAGAKWDRRADVFSLAAILHEVFWGRRGAGGSRQVADALTELPGADLTVLRSTFARALAEDPADRFETALEFATALKTAFPGLTRREPAVERAPLLPLDGPEPAVDVTAEPVLVIANAAADIELRPDDSHRYQNAEPGAAIMASSNEPPVEPLVSRPSGRLLELEGPDPPESALERSRSAIWPLALALFVGLGLGFPVGYVVGIRDRALPVAAVSIPGAAPQQPPAPSREWTEGAVSEARKPAPAQSPQAPPAPPAPPAPMGQSARAADGAVSPGASRTASRPTTAAVEAGRLLVRSTPAGARVFVDGRDRGRTPAAIRDLARGTHRIRLVQEGYATEERRVVITAARAEQTLSLALARTRIPEPAAPPPASSLFGSLSVESRPVGASVFIDGKLVGTTPVVLAQIGGGDHVVRLEHDGYRRWSSSVRVASGERNRITASLEER